MRPWQIVLAATIAYVLIILAASEFDPMVFVRVGSRFENGIPDGSMGYDGQFAYQIARSPLSSPQKLDVPAYRLQRIFYPLLARGLALGIPSLIPWTLIAVNLITLVAGVAATEEILRHFNRSQWFALAYGFNVGIFMAVRLDLTEPLAYCLVQLGVLAWVRGRRDLSSLWFAGALLAKEVTLLLIVGYVLTAAAEFELKRTARWVGLLFGPFLIWQGILTLWIGSPGIGSGGALSTRFELIPYRGWWGIAGYDLSGFLFISILIVPMVILPSIFGVWVAVRALTEEGWRASGCALLAQSAAFAVLPMSNILDPLGASRFSIGLICGLLNAGGEYRGQRRALVYSQLWIVTLAFLLGDSLLPRA